MSGKSEAFSHTLSVPVDLPDRAEPLAVLEFPRMKGKWMRAYQVKIDATKAGEAAAGASSQIAIDYGLFMELGERMLAEKMGPVTARLIFDEMDPGDVHELVGVLGEKFAGGLRIGPTA